MRKQFRVTPETRSQTMRTAARAYIKAGLPVLLIHGVLDDGSCTCGKPDCGKVGKHPIIEVFPKGVHSATTSFAKVDQALRQHPSANVAIALKGLTVVDIDGPAGRKGVRALKLPKTPKVITGRGAHHYLQGELAEGTFKGAQVDVLTGPNRYVLAPPSMHASGKRYRWSKVGGTVAALPPSRITQLRPKRPPAKGKTHGKQFGGSIPAGARNDTLFRFAGYARHRRFSDATIRKLVDVLNGSECTVPLDEDEVEKLLDSSARYEEEPLFAPVGNAKVLPLEAVWYPYIMRHCVTVLAGDPGRGKSLLLSLITAIITRGGAWPLSDQKAKKGPVLLLSAEDSFERVTLARLAAVHADVSLLHRMEKFRALDPERLEYLADYVRQIKPELVIIDTLSAYLGSGRDMNRQNEVGEFLAKLNEIAEEVGCAIVALAHLNKTTAEHPLFRIVGSIGIVASVRSALFLGADPTDQSRLALAHGKANGTPLGPTITFDKVGGGENAVPVLVPGEVIDADANAVCRVPREAVGPPALASEAAGEFLLEYLTEEPKSWGSVMLAAEARSIASPATLNSVRGRLVEEDRIEQVGKARKAMWRLKVAAEPR